MDASIRFVRSSAPLTAAVDGEVVMLDPATSRYYGLEGVAARIWDLYEAPHSVDELVVALRAEFDVDEPTCRTEVLAFAGELEAAGLIQPDAT